MTSVPSVPDYSAYNSGIVNYGRGNIHISGSAIGQHGQVYDAVADIRRHLDALRVLVERHAADLEDAGHVLGDIEDIEQQVTAVRPDRARALAAVERLIDRTGAVAALAEQVRNLRTSIEAG